MTQTYHLHLVSDSTGETVSSVYRAVMAQFEGIEIEEHVWSLVRTQGQMERVMDGIRENPGVVLYTLVEKPLQEALQGLCAELKVPCISVLNRIIRDLSNYWDIETHAAPGKQHHILDEDYFSRVEAINYSLNHDDGQSGYSLDEADIILVGVSRTSKSPTCMYLAYRGYYAANVPYVSGCPLPPELETNKNSLIVGLTISPEPLIAIRRNRLLTLKEERATEYVDEDSVRSEILESRKFFRRHGWPVIDVSRRSVEETAAQIIQLYEARNGKRRKGM